MSLEPVHTSVRRPLVSLLVVVVTGVACDDATTLRASCVGPLCLAPDANAGTDVGPMGDASVPECSPAEERCNGTDDDCDGVVDESFPERGPCGIDLGACQAGTSRCVDGALRCEGEVVPGDEVCNLDDDDCDGLVDESPTELGEVCGEATACGSPVTLCMAGQAVCGDTPVPSNEDCNGLDDDCDGATDEALPGIGDVCGSNAGDCRPGVRACADGQWVCEGEVPGTPEVCNGLDDDCNGNVDDATVDASVACGEGTLCQGGLTVCIEGQLRCEGALTSGDERCDGTDEDCDGQIDESFPEQGVPCGVDLGACSAGETRCIGGQLTCFGRLGPVPEACDGEDNDCDGATDEADDQHDGGPCPDLGDRCVESAQCGPGGRCLDDYGQNYCSTVCDGPEDCGAGTYCGRVAGLEVCRRVYAPCVADETCAAGERCMLVPSPDPARFGGECRPALPEGLPVDAPCGPETGPCATNLCLADVERCSALCASSDGCGEGLACIGTPFVLGNREQIDVGLCLGACTGDADCDPEVTGFVCLYDLALGGEGFRGHCDVPRAGGRPGDPCDLSADPPRGCVHGYCRRDARGRYCTQGCEAADDCPDGWNCVPSELQTAEGVFTLGLCQRL